LNQERVAVNFDATHKAMLGKIYLAFVLIATGGFLFGYIIGINSDVLSEGQLTCSSSWTGPVGTWTSFGYHQCYRLGDWQEGILSSLNLVGATVSSLVCFKYADILGRKRQIQIAASLYFIGALATSTSPTLWGVYVGFTIYGLGIGFAMHAAPVYIAEISPAEFRGTLMAAKELIIVFGIVAGFASGAMFLKVDVIGWRVMVGIAAFCSLIMHIGMYFIPNSPRWLILRSVQATSVLLELDHVQEARDALSFFHSDLTAEEIEAELNEIRNDATEAESLKSGGICAAFQYPKPLIIGCGLVFFQQATGQPAVLYFATNIFQAAGFNTFAALSALSVGIVKLLATLFSVWRVDEFGRRYLLLMGISMMILSLGVLSIAFTHLNCEVNVVTMSDCQLADISLPKPWAIATVFALMVYVSGYQIGFGPISWLMISEIFPLGVRGAALSTAAVVNFSVNILVNLSQLAAMKAFSPAGTFLGYFVFALASVIFVFYRVPETKGKTLEVIEREMTGRDKSKTHLSIPSHNSVPHYGAT
jgi:sugar porter (SP) family MFS transporter